jgi:hypothetical protein
VLEILRSKLRTLPELDGEQVPTFVVGGADEAPAAVGAIIDAFGRDRALPAVRVLLDAGTVGYLERSDVDVFVYAPSKGFGDSGGASLPGIPPAGAMREFAFRCPVAGCPQSPLHLLAFTSVPRCRLHDVQLELVDEPQ